VVLNGLVGEELGLGFNASEATWGRYDDDEDIILLCGISRAEMETCDDDIHG